MSSGNLHSEGSPSEGVQALSQTWMKILRDRDKGSQARSTLTEMMLRSIDSFALQPA